jgi:hypothetical protein
LLLDLLGRRLEVGFDLCFERRPLGFQLRFGASTNGSGRDVQSQAALQDCRNGRVNAGIAQLEQLRRDDRIPVPGEPSSASR